MFDGRAVGESLAGIAGLALAFVALVMIARC